MAKVYIIGAALLFGVLLTGCHNTAEGLAEDAKENQKAAAKTAEEAQKSAAPTIEKGKEAVAKTAAVTKEAAKNVSAAVILTPKVKLAIQADKGLNDSRNHIIVQSKDNVVHLTGSVYSDEMKKRAEEVTQKVLTEGKSTDKLSNELVVQKS